MGTRSTIAVAHADGTVTQVYCHWDGYIENNGKLLVENYNSRELAKLLVSFGDMSSLDKYVIPAPESAHSYGNREPGITVYYGRDRGETGTGPRTFLSMDDYRSNMQSEEYDYLFTAGAWFVREHGEFAGIVTELLGMQQEAE